MHFYNAKQTRLGSELSASDRRAVLASYVHRFTKEHRPQWANRADCAGCCPVQFESDTEWLAHTRFAVTKAGALDGLVKECESSATWPDNPELRKPAKVAA